MTTKHAAFATSTMRALALAVGLIGLAAQPSLADWKAPWKDEDRALVIDAYEFNPIDWKKMTSDERIAGFINKASDGLPPAYRCGSKSGDDWKLCTNRWWRYSVTKELYMTRRQMADALGLLWGAYHLARPGNPREQADHFLRFAEPRENDLVALDIEDLSDEFMSLEDAEIFADQIKKRIGRYPVLYTNGNTAKFISENREDYPILSRLPLWYARYSGDISGKFPEETWPDYALWQFSSMHNCNARSCPYRVDGAKDDIDVNVSTMDLAGLKAAWPFDELHDLPEPDVDPSALIASVDGKVKRDVARTRSSRDGVEMLAAYGPDGEHPHIDPLELLKETALQQSHGIESSAGKRIEKAAARKEEREAKAGVPAPGMPIPEDNPRRKPSLAVGNEASEETADAIEDDVEKSVSKAERLDVDRDRDAAMPGEKKGPRKADISSDEDPAARPADPEADAFEETSWQGPDAPLSLAAYATGDRRIEAAFTLTN